MLADLPSLKLALRINVNDTGQDNYLLSLLAIADQAVKLHTKRDLETTSYTEYRDGSGVEAMATRQRPVTVSSVQVWLDAKGFGGQASGAFASATLLTLGTDYLVDSDDGITSQNGLIRRLAAGVLADFGNFAWAFRRGSLTANLAAGWPRGYRNVKISYTAGYGVGATATTNLPANTTIPTVLTDAVCKLAIWQRMMMPIGLPLDISKSAQDVGAILNGRGPGSDEPEIISVRGMLRRYRETSM